MRFSQTKKYLRHPQVVLSNPPTAVGVSCTILKIAVFTSIWAPYLFISDDHLGLAVTP